MTQAQNAPGWFKVVAIIALIWNLLGVGAFVMQMMMTPEMIAALPEDQQALYEALPLWATIAFALAVFGGFLGSLFLVLKKGIAWVFFAASLLGLIGQNYHSFAINKVQEVYGAGSAILPALVFALALYLLWLSRHAIKKEWIG